MAKTQQEKALEKGNRVRHDRAELKKMIRTGEVPVETVIEHPPAFLKTSPRHRSRVVTIVEVLSWQHRWGRIRAEKFLQARRDLRLQPNQELCRLSVGRRRQLARAISSV